MVFEFSCERLRERRTFVMGVAALMIYFAHFYAYADLGLLNKLFAYGNWGVDVFLLLSGFACVIQCPNLLLSVYFTGSGLLVLVFLT